MLFAVLLRILFESDAFLNALRIYFENEPEIQRVIKVFKMVRNPTGAARAFVKQQASQAFNDTLFQEIHDLYKSKSQQLAAFINKYNPAAQLQQQLTALTRQFQNKVASYLGVPRHPWSEFKRVVGRFGREAVVEHFSPKTFPGRDAVADYDDDWKERIDPSQKQRRIARINVIVKLSSTALLEGAFVGTTSQKTINQQYENYTKEGGIKGHAALTFRGAGYASTKVYHYYNIDYKLWSKMVQAHTPYGAWSVYLDALRRGETFPVTYWKPVGRQKNGRWKYSPEQRKYMTAKAIVKYYKRLARLQRHKPLQQSVFKKTTPRHRNVDINPLSQMRGVRYERQVVGQSTYKKHTPATPARRLPPQIVTNKKGTTYIRKGRLIPARPAKTTTVTRNRTRVVPVRIFHDKHYSGKGFTNRKKR